MISRPTVGYRPVVGIRNFLIEGVSGTGKTSVCRELRQRGYHAINGDTELAYQGDPETGEPTDGVPSHWHHIWRVDRVRALVADQTKRFTFFCGGSRNFSKFVDLFDAVFRPGRRFGDPERAPLSAAGGRVRCTAIGARPHLASASHQGGRSY